MGEVKDINVKKFDSELYWAIKTQAAREKTTVKELITRVMREYLSKKVQRKGR